jgi:hypothetical protein
MPFEIVISGAKNGRMGPYATKRAALIDAKALTARTGGKLRTSVKATSKRVPNRRGGSNRKGVKRRPNGIIDRARQAGALMARVHALPLYLYVRQYGPEKAVEHAATLLATRGIPPTASRPFIRMAIRQMGVGDGVAAMTNPAPRRREVSPYDAKHTQGTYEIAVPGALFDRGSGTFAGWWKEKPAPWNGKITVLPDHYPSRRAALVAATRAAAKPNPADWGTTFDTLHRKYGGAKPPRRRNHHLKIGDRVQYAEAGLRHAPAGRGMESHRYAASLRGTVVATDGRYYDVRWDGYSRATRVKDGDVTAARGRTPSKARPATRRRNPKARKSVHSGEKPSWYIRALTGPSNNQIVAGPFASVTAAKQEAQIRFGERGPWDKLRRAIKNDNTFYAYHVGDRYSVESYGPWWAF